MSKTAVEMIGRAVAEAEQLGVAVAIAVVDHTGRTIGFASMPGAPLIADEVATAKAYTAATFGRITSDLASIIPTDMFAQLAAVSERPLVTLPGGIPLVRDEVAAGGVGVSGGDANQDERIALAAASVR